MESLLLLDRPSTQSRAGVPCRVDVPSMNSSFRTSHEVSSHETLVMQWAPCCSQNTCKIPNRLSACADLVSTYTSNFTSLSLHPALPQSAPGLHLHVKNPWGITSSPFPVSWILQKKKKNQTSCPSHCGETHEILSCFFCCCCCCFKPKSIQLCKIPGKSVPVGKKELYLSAVSLLRSCSFLVYLCQTWLLPSAYSVTSVMSSSLQLYGL